MDDVVWNRAVLSKNRERLLTSDMAQQLFAEVNESRPFRPVSARPHHRHVDCFDSGTRHCRCRPTSTLLWTNAVKPGELSEIITHLAFYSGGRACRRC
jgi:hypothetical protein